MTRVVSTAVDERASSITGIVMAGAAVAALATLALVEEAADPRRKHPTDRHAAAAKPEPTKRAARPRWEAIERAARARPAPLPAEEENSAAARHRGTGSPRPPRAAAPPAPAADPVPAPGGRSPPSPRPRPGRAEAPSAHPLGRDLAAIGDLSRRKRAFIAALLPFVREENERVLEERRRAETRPSSQLYRRYGVTPGDRRTLLRRIDAVPASLAIAQAAIESGWGTSRFVYEANNLFGERTYKKSARGVAPREADGFKITSFSSIAASVRSYIHNLNSNAAYRAFRLARAARPKARGIELARHLASYSELRGAYVATIRRVIEENDLHRLDFARLANR